MAVAEGSSDGQHPPEGKAASFEEDAIEIPKGEQPLLDRLRVGDGYRFWLAGGGYDRNLDSAKAIWNSIEYVHANPVRKGLVRAVGEYRWSSARFYSGVESNEFEPDVCDVFAD